MMQRIYNLLLIHPTGIDFLRETFENICKQKWHNNLLPEKLIGCSILFILLSFSSCKKVIDFKLNNANPIIIVDGSITTEQKAHEVTIQLTSDFFNAGESKMATGAKVSITDGTTTYPLTELTSGHYFTQPNVKGQEKTVYTLTVEYENKNYTASDSLTKKVPMSNLIPFQPLDTLPFSQPAKIDSSYSLIIFAQEPPELGNSYVWKYRVNGALASDTLLEWYFSDDAFFNGQNPINGWVLFPAPGNSIPNRNINKNDTITLEMYAVTHNYLNYIISVFRQTQFRGTLFDTAPANLPTNFSEGAVGYFYAAAVTKDTALAY